MPTEIVHVKSRGSLPAVDFRLEPVAWDPDSGEATLWSQTRTTWPGDDQPGDVECSIVSREHRDLLTGRSHF